MAPSRRPPSWPSESTSSTRPRPMSGQVPPALEPPHEEGRLELPAVEAQRAVGRGEPDEGVLEDDRVREVPGDLRLQQRELGGDSQPRRVQRELAREVLALVCARAREDRARGPGTSVAPAPPRPRLRPRRTRGWPCRVSVGSGRRGDLRGRTWRGGEVEGRGSGWRSARPPVPGRLDGSAGSGSRRVRPGRGSAGCRAGASSAGAAPRWSVATRAPPEARRCRSPASHTPPLKPLAHPICCTPSSPVVAAPVTPVQRRCRTGTASDRRTARGGMARCPRGGGGRPREGR